MVMVTSDDGLEDKTTVNDVSFPPSVRAVEFGFTLIPCSLEVEGSPKNAKNLVFFLKLQL